MQQSSARVGDSVASVATPALVIDLDAMERNLAAMAGFARSHGIRLRPHAKMHKSATLAKAQIAAGAVGICAQKVSEAEVLADAGIADIFISNEVIDEAKLMRVAALAGRIKLAIAVDSILGVDRLADATSSRAACASRGCRRTRAEPSTSTARSSAGRQPAARRTWCARRRRASARPALRARS